MKAEDLADISEECGELLALGKNEPNWPRDSKTFMDRIIREGCANFDSLYAAIVRFGPAFAGAVNGAVIAN